MLILGLLYLCLALGALIALTHMILRIGVLAGDCPTTRTRAKAVTITIATGFAAIGAGGVIMIGAILPLLIHQPFGALMLALGMASLCLGLGFTHAMGTLRAALVPADPHPAQADAA